MESSIMQTDVDRRCFVSSAAAFLFTAGVMKSQRIVGHTTTPASEIRPFQIQVPEQKLRDIRSRLAAVQWPKTSQGAGWTYGVDAGWFRDFVTYWRDRYDWQAAETALNRCPQFMTAIEGRQVHFAHLRPQSGAADKKPPLLLLHGWPYTFATMLPLAERMAREGFEVVVPSLPGVAFSQAADDRIKGLRFISRRIDELMNGALGYDRYLIHAGDHGAVIADWLALDVPDHVAGIHANQVSFRHHGAEFGSGNTGVSDATPEEKAFVAAEKANVEKESAYFKLQFTRPETIVYALSDSPAGWAAYMLDKWQKWTDPKEGFFEAVYGRDRLLTEVMLFLVTDSVATALWPYAGFATEPFSLQPGQKITVPFGYSEFPDPLAPPHTPRHFAARSRTDIRLWRVHDRGGHFPMLDSIDVLARDIRDFADLLES
jgi:pimeloyl-ACP methyl ester carboxylesterase